METTTETSIEREIAIAARPETVWEFLVDPEKAIRWMGMSARLDPRPGGEYRVDVCPGQTAGGEFVELDPPHRLVWTWGWEKDSSSDVPSDRRGSRCNSLPRARARCCVSATAGCQAPRT